MNAVKRRAAIARFIAERDGADVQTLAEHFGVSPMTIRRDRKILAEQNKLAATHGGAVPPDYQYGEPPYAQKIDINVPAKRAIARQAAAMIRDDSCIILDAGTTTLELAKLLLPRRLSVITVDLQIALLLAHSSTVRVFTPGGQVDSETAAQLDMQSVNYLQATNPAISFIGSAVWDLRKGVSTTSISKQTIKRLIKNQAEKSILLADSSKYGQCNPWSISPLESFSCIITDWQLDNNVRTAVKAAGVNLILAD